MRKLSSLALSLVAAACLACTTGCNTPTVAKGDSGYAARLQPIRPYPVPITSAPLTEMPFDRQ
ncbi:MAG TPA: hypothetical protein VM008_18985 [Phycisphaerae bacterium]|nr:hypothetical protein [Phycisphaerae bacterium]